MIAKVYFSSEKKFIMFQTMRFTSRELIDSLKIVGPTGFREGAD